MRAGSQVCAARALRALPGEAMTLSRTVWGLLIRMLLTEVTSIESHQITNI